MNSIYYINSLFLGTLYLKTLVIGGQNYKINPEFQNDPIKIDDDLKVPDDSQESIRIFYNGDDDLSDHNWFKYSMYANSNTKSNTLKSNDFLQRNFSNITSNKDENIFKSPFGSQREFTTPKGKQFEEDDLNAQFEGQVLTPNEKKSIFTEFYI